MFVRCVNIRDSSSRTVSLKANRSCDRMYNRVQPRSHSASRHCLNMVFVLIWTIHPVCLNMVTTVPSSVEDRKHSTATHINHNNENKRHPEARKTQYSRTQGRISLVCLDSPVLSKVILHQVSDNVISY